ncbi:DUF4468 domain-containing protein [Hymenobacter sp. J193]|uniref:DUF4468 domain-containing protein n=1 Tax=Hymenobacter sp. J193 TaxID=2898429 RepID=UPI0021507975|nr:DUF4468 domain-containing protein [Hymenobacter sp. J193]MCR5887468.1 DUF4468 domain-containing protein [Hymenobacter sp. J193]
MKKTLFTVVAAALLTVSTGHVLAQNHEPLQYAETVAAPEPGKAALFGRAAEWVDKRFAFGPTSDVVNNAATGTLRITGTAKVQPVSSSGKNEERAVRFDFTFHCTDQGYDYRVDNFRYIADPANPTELVLLEEYVTQLSLQKATVKTHNDRRLRAQAMSLASEVAMAFRS